MALDFLQQANAAYIDSLYEQYRRQPDSVPHDWQIFFAGLEAGSGNGAEAAPARPKAAPAAPPVARATEPPAGLRPADVKPVALASTPATGAPPRTAAGTEAENTIGVFDLVHSYRELGHFIANLDPLGNNGTSHPLLELHNFNLSDIDLERTVQCASFYGCSQAKLADLVMLLRATYCGTVGVEYMHISSKDQ